MKKSIYLSDTENKTSFSHRYEVALILAFVGGFMESYTYITRNGVFANAQTGNIARMGMSLAAGDMVSALRYLIPIIMFFTGVTLSVQLKKSFRRPLHWRQTVLLLEILLLVIVSFVPIGRMDILATALVSLMCALQVEGFRKFGNSNFSTTMCTGNLRSGTELINRYLEEHDKETLLTGLKYFGIDGVFLVGASVGFRSTSKLSSNAVWICIAVLVALLILFSVLQDEYPDLC